MSHEAPNKAPAPVHHDQATRRAQRILWAKRILSFLMLLASTAIFARIRGRIEVMEAHLKAVEREYQSALDLLSLQCEEALQCANDACSDDLTQLKSRCEAYSAECKRRTEEVFARLKGTETTCGNGMTACTALVKQADATITDLKEALTNATNLAKTYNAEHATCEREKTKLKSECRR